MAQARAGDTVEVAAGEYREQVTLKNGVTLAQPRSARGGPAGGPAVGTGPAVIADGVKGARLQRLPDPGGCADARFRQASCSLIPRWKSTIRKLRARGSGSRFAAADVSPCVGNTIHDCTAEGVLITGTSHAVDLAQLLRAQ